MSDDAMASRLYGETPAPAAVEPATKVEPARATTVEAVEAAIVGRLYANPEVEFDVPAEIKAMRAAPEHRMYNQTARPEINNAITDDVTPEVKAAIARELTSMCDDVGLNGDDIMSITSAAKRMALEPPSAEQITTMQTDAVDALNNAFGVNAKAAHAAAVALVARDPRVAQYIARAGLGNDPATVLRLARIAMGKRA